MANEASKFTMADGTDVSIVDSRIGDLTSTGITGSTVAAQLKELNSKYTALNSKIPIVLGLTMVTAGVDVNGYLNNASHGMKLFYFSSNNGNKPTANGGFAIVIKGNYDFTKMIWFEANTNNIFIKTKDTSNISEWQKLNIT